MNNVYFKASLQNTLNPEVGTFDNVYNKEGTFTLEDGEYYLTNNTSTPYKVYYPTKNLYSVGFTIEFDINYQDYSDFKWCLLFSNDTDSYKYWYGFGVEGKTLQFRGQTTSRYNIVTSPSTWLHVKCIFDYYLSEYHVHIYIDNNEVRNFTINDNYGIKNIDILGSSSGNFIPDGTKVKNIIIYDIKKHYLDTTGLTSLWSKIKYFFATKTELANKANISDLNNYYTKEQIDNMLKKVESDTQESDKT